MYSIRRESDALNGYGSAVGLGYLLTASVAITSSDVIIDQSSCL